MALIEALLLATSAAGFANVNVDAQPHVEKDSVAHVEKGALQATGAIHVDSNAVHTEPITGTIWAKAEVQPNGITAPTTVQPNAVHVESDAVSMKPGAIVFTTTTQPKTINIEIDPGAIVIHAEGITDAAMKPMQELKAGLMATGNEAKQWLIVLVVVGFATAITAIVVGIAVHFHHMKERAKLEAR